MSKKLIIALLLVIGFSSLAQEQSEGDKKSKKPKREQMSPEQRNQALLDRMTKELTLTAEQQEQIKPIIADQSAKTEAMKAERMNGNGKKMSKDEREAFKAKRQEEKKETDAKFQVILTAEQFKKMKSNEVAAREKMRESRGDGNWGRNRENSGNGDNGENGNNEVD